MAFVHNLLNAKTDITYSVCSIAYLKFPALRIDRGNFIFEDGSEESCFVFIHSLIH